MSYNGIYIPKHSASELTQADKAVPILYEKVKYNTQEF